jgi:hypothetical protein
MCIVEHCGTWAAREARTSPWDGQAKWTKDTGWAVTGHGRPFLQKKIACGARIWPDILYFSVLISFPEDFTLGHDTKV